MSLNFSLAQENDMLVDAVGEAMKPWTNARKSELRDMVDKSIFPAELWQTFADVGLLGCLVPEQYGGTDAGLLPLALAVCGAVLGFRRRAVRALLVVLLSPQTAGIAIARLINPLGNKSWPRENELRFDRPPSKLASGSMFEVELVDGNEKLPELVVIQYRFEAESNEDESNEPFYIKLRVEAPRTVLEGQALQHHDRRSGADTVVRQATRERAAASASLPHASRLRDPSMWWLVRERDLADRARLLGITALGDGHVARM